MLEQQESWKFIVAVLIAVLGITGAILTFLNGRLKDADGPEGPPARPII